MEEKFRIISYGFGELAMLYFPNSTKKSASAQLGRWIRQNEKLENKLKDFGFVRGKKLLTPNQVNKIVEFLGNP